MRALGVRKWGKSDKLEVLGVPVPSIGNPNDILIRVKAVGLNQADAVKALGYARLLDTDRYIYLPLFNLQHSLQGPDTDS